MKTIYEARKYIKENIGKKVKVNIKNIRNKNEIVTGIITECYSNVFIVDSKMGKKSFSYTDVLISNIEVNFI